MHDDEVSGMVDITVAVPRNLGDEALRDLAQTLGVAMPEMVRAAEAEGGLSVIAEHLPDYCPACLVGEGVTWQEYEPDRRTAWVWVEDYPGWPDDWYHGDVLPSDGSPDEVRVSVGLLILGCDECGQGERYETVELTYPAREIGANVLTDRNPPPPGPDWGLEAKYLRRPASRARTAMRVLLGRCQSCGRKERR